MSVVDHFVEEMLTSPHHVLVYDEGQESVAHEVIEGVVAALVEEIRHSTPDLENLIVLDSSRANWDEVAPALEPATLSDLTSGDVVLSRHQCIVAFGNGFLRSALVHPFTKANKFYAAVKLNPQINNQIRRVHPLRKALILP